MGYQMLLLNRMGFTTNFPATENPISESGRWTNGGTVGLDWQNVRTDGSSAYGVAISAGYDDCIAVASGLSPSSHSAQATCKRVGGYTPPDTHECELHVAQSISANSASGYEITWNFGGGLQAVRWNGPLAGFTIQTAADDSLGGGKGWTDVATGSGGSALVNGDVMKVTFQLSSGSPLITVYQNGAQIYQVADTSAYKITSGQPGMGFFGRSGATMSSYCWSSFTGASL